MRVERWDQQLSTDESNEVLLLLARWHLSFLQEGDNRARIAAMLDSGDYKALCHYDVPISGGASDYQHTRQIMAFFQKRKDLVLEGVDPQAAAWTTFVEAEALCRQSNEIFRSQLEGGFYFHPRVESVLYVAQQKISRILGDLPELSELKLRFGPGATTQVKKKDASARRKLSQVFCCSEDAIALIPDVLAEMPDWSQVSREASGTDPVCNVRVDNARVDFVRKTAKTDRTIAVEPMLNGMVQLAIGDYISGRLRQFGVDLRDQTLNQRLAREGSITGALATLDLSSASDTVSYGLVLSLLPCEWVEFLAQIRTARVETPHGLVTLEKFSTMGNGFTFALESLIFFAIAKAAVELDAVQGPVSVYGDDIIVPTESFGLVTECLVACGFLVNGKKSFSDGPFRESCGKDYYSGISVRPAYVKDVLSGEAIFILHNHYVRIGLGEPASILLSMISDDLRIYGPDGYGDGHLLGGPDTRVRHKANEGWAGYTFETFTWKATRRFYTLGADYVFPSYSVYVSGDTDVAEPIYPKVAREHVPLVVERQPLVGPRKRGWTVVSATKAVLRPHGNVRPDRVQASYQTDQKGGSHLSDSLPGVQGYKRIKIYTLG